MKNEIVYRVYDFLKNYPPFSMVHSDILMNLSGQVSIQFVPSGTLLFRMNDPAHSFFYIVQSGALQLTGANNVLVDEYDEGDIIGLRPLLAQSEYILNCRAAENSLVYAIPFEHFMLIMQKNQSVLNYLMTNFASGLGQQYKSSAYLSTATSPQTNVVNLDEILYVQPTSNPIYCPAETTIREAAQLMSKMRIGSLIVCDSTLRPIGIITDKDLRTKVVAGNIKRSAPITDIMTSPVICIPNKQSIAQIQISMIRNRISHLAITQDGTPQSPLVGVVSEHDLLIQQGENPAFFIHLIRRKNSRIEDLKHIRDKTDHLTTKYLQQDVSIDFISEIVSQINQELIHSIINRHLDLLSYDKTIHGTFAWLNLGSMGRKEQILRTDQDNALIFAPPHEVKLESVQSFYLELAQKVVSDLEIVGFEKCPANMMASNAQWCQSLSQWKNTFEKWMRNPGEQEVMMTTIFFDYAVVYGDNQLATALDTHIKDCLSKDALYIHLLAKDAIQNPPPLSFFRNFIVEKNGDHKDQFDIKARAMLPLADAARVLIFNHRILSIQNTSDRFTKLAELEPQKAELYHAAANAYHILLKIKTKNGIHLGTSGRYFNPSSLDKMSRMSLKNTFNPIDELQDLIKIRFQLSKLL